MCFYLQSTSLKHKDTEKHTEKSKTEKTYQINANRKTATIPLFVTDKIVKVHYYGYEHL